MTSGSQNTEPMVPYASKVLFDIMIVLNMLNDILGKESVGCHYVPNAFLMSCLVFIGTFLISFHLKKVNRFSIMLLWKYIRFYLPYSMTDRLPH